MAMSCSRKGIMGESIRGWATKTVTRKEEAAKSNSGDADGESGLPNKW
jgi:hypothetical protein